MLPWAPLNNNVPFTFPNPPKGANADGAQSYVKYRDGRGNPPNLCILYFPLPLSVTLTSQNKSLELTRVNVYLKSGSPTVYTHLESRGVYGVEDHLEYHYFLLTGVHGESYAVNWTLPDGTRTPVTPVDAFAYYPPIPDPERAHSNAAMLVQEHVRRAFIVHRQHGVQCVLLRRLRSGPRCTCYNPELGDGQRDCPYCYGTGIEGGYTVFPRILARGIPAGVRLNAFEGGILVDASPRAHMPIVPEITDRDMIYRMWPEGRLNVFEIHNVQRRSTGEGPADIPVIQEFSLKLMEAHEPVYRAIEELVPAGFKPVETAVEPGLPRER